MILLYLCFVILMFIPFPKHVNCASNEYEHYLDKDNTLPIKGFFVVFVFFAHFTQYVSLSRSILDVAFGYVHKWSGQLIVTLFLFYSGFGIYESIKTKENYMRGFIKKRFFPVWLSFAVCVSFFLIYDLIVGQEYDLPTIAFSFIGWKSVGNSTWFMFVTFVLYLLAFFVFSIIAKITQKQSLLLVLFTIGTVLLIIALYYLKNPTWYNTVLCFPLGMWYSFYKEKINNCLAKHYWLALIGVLLLFICSYIIYLRYPLAFCVCSCIFAFLVILITVRVRFRSPIFAFLGKHVFSIYILQRLVFLVLQDCFENIYIFFIVSFAVTVLVATIYDKFYNLCFGVWVKRVNRKLNRKT